MIGHKVKKYRFKTLLVLFGILFLSIQVHVQSHGHELGTGHSHETHLDEQCQICDIASSDQESIYFEGHGDPAFVSFYKEGPYSEFLPVRFEDLYLGRAPPIS